MGDWAGFASLRMDEWFVWKLLLIDLVLEYPYNPQNDHSILGQQRVKLDIKYSRNIIIFQSHLLLFKISITPSLVFIICEIVFICNLWIVRNTLYFVKSKFKCIILWSLIVVIYLLQFFLFILNKSIKFTHGTHTPELANPNGSLLNS